MNVGRTNLKLFFLAPALASALAPSASFAAREAGYFSVPKAESRAASGSGYFVVSEFPTIYLVEEGSGRPNNEIVSNIDDAVVRADIENRSYKSLQVRELALRPNHKIVKEDTVNLPFVISLKHDRRGNGVTEFLQRGTIEVAGTLEIKHDGTGLSARVSRFDDSQFAEWAGRRVGLNSELDLEFARAVVPAGIEAYYNADPHRIETLLTNLDVALTTP